MFPYLDSITSDLNDRNRKLLAMYLKIREAHERIGTRNSVEVSQSSLDNSALGLSTTSKKIHSGDVLLKLESMNSSYNTNGADQNLFDPKPL
jgi:hypothetical protein